MLAGSAPPKPPRLASASGLMRRSSASPFGRFLNHHQFLEPRKTEFIHTERMPGAKKRDPREQFLYVFCGLSSVCGTPKNEILIYRTHSGCQKDRPQRAIPICILWIIISLWEPLKTKFLYTERMPGPKKRDPREQFVFCGLSSVCGTSKNEIPIYRTHAGTPKERPQRAIPICILRIIISLRYP